MPSVHLAQPAGWVAPEGGGTARTVAGRGRSASRQGLTPCLELRAVATSARYPLWFTVWHVARGPHERFPREMEGVYGIEDPPNQEEWIPEIVRIIASPREGILAEAGVKITQVYRPGSYGGRLQMLRAHFPLG